MPFEFGTITIDTVTQKTVRMFRISGLCQQYLRNN
jgi:hypothetical protein